MDTPGELGKDRYETWDELYVYCYRVASTVKDIYLCFRHTVLLILIFPVFFFFLRLVASPCLNPRQVGLMTLPVMGTAEGYTEEEAKPPAISLGIALQITNILRDVGEDAVK